MYDILIYSSYIKVIVGVRFMASSSDRQTDIIPFNTNIEIEYDPW